MLMDYRTATYLMYVEGALEEERVPAQYLTDTCPECGEAVTEYLDAMEGPHVVTRVSNDPEGPKGYYVIIACEGFWVINPESVGLPLDNWQDWTVVTADDVAEANGADYPECANPACDHRLCYMERRDLDECPACSHAIPVALRLNDTMDGPRD